VHAYKAKNLGELWEKEKGSKSAWMIYVASLTFCFGAALSYSILLGDAFSALAHTDGLSRIGASRSFWILLVTSTTLSPLCNLESLLALTPLPVMGVFAMLITTIFSGWRCPALDMSCPYATASSGAMLQSSHQLPKFTTFCKVLDHPHR
jgi:amino acid permease